MDIQQITEALAKMEQNLQGVESARQQVLQVSNAYNGTRTQLEGLATTISQMSVDIRNVVSAITSNQEFVSESYKNWLLNNFNDLDKRANEISNAAQNIQKKFSDECKTISTNFTNATGNAQNSFSQRLLQSSDDFKATLAHASTEFKTALAQTNTDFNAALTQSSDTHKREEAAIIQNFKDSIDKFSSSFTRTQEEMKNLLDDYRREINVFWGKMDSQLSPISSAIKELSDKNDTLQKQVNTNKILLVAILVAVLISILLRFV